MPARPRPGVVDADPKCEGLLTPVSRTLYISCMSNSPDPVFAASVRAPLADAAAPVASTPWSRLASAMWVRPGLLIALGAALAAAGRPLLWMNVLIIPIDVVTLLLVHRLLRAEGRGLADLLRPVRGGDLAWGLLCGLIVVLAWFPASFIAGLVAYRGPMPTAAHQSVPLWIALVSVTIMPVTIGLAEEALYRGYLQPRLAGVLGQARAVITASAFFAVQHIAFAPFDDLRHRAHLPGRARVRRAAPVAQAGDAAGRRALAARPARARAPAAARGAGVRGRPWNR